MQAVTYGQANTLYGDLVNKTTGSAIVTGTTTFYLVVTNGANAGKWWKASDETWSATEVSAGTGTYVGGSMWSVSVALDAWESNGTYRVYLKEAADTYRPYTDDVVCTTGASAFIGSAPGVLDVCNMAISIIGGAAAAQVEMLDTIDGNPADPSASKTLGWVQLWYPRARDKVLTRLAGPRAIQYIDPGAALADAVVPTNPGWTYWFARPPSALKILAVVQEASHYAQVSSQLTQWFYPWPQPESSTPIYTSVPYEEVGGNIGCDYDDIMVQAVVGETDVTKWPIMTVHAVAAELAFDLSRVCGVDSIGQASLRKLAALAFIEALGEQQSEVYVPGQQVFADHSLF